MGTVEGNPCPNRTQPLPGLDVLHRGLCLEPQKKEDFPYRCDTCSQMIYCADCLKAWFLGACKNESKMPPKCCEIIPFETVSNLLKPTESELYKAKFLEWRTVDRLYCPVPSCSAFIPPSHYTDQEEKPNLEPGGSHGRAEVINAPGTPLAHEVTKRPIVACPKCSTPVCTMCRSHKHPGDCSEKDLVPELEQLLPQGKIKRCPGCRTGVGKAYGCHHIQCRCGANFCYSCLRSINICGGCEEAVSGMDDSDDRIFAMSATEHQPTTSSAPIFEPEFSYSLNPPS
ncbi:hypothetical protein BJ875DRAFT_16154 [Amylocarpus encephaloides]|uniref:RBR-type E3 ubiquitin transferase n=1 Tax=Amylocarpus encephaloides TaxID=45428 RepID=A0A9P7YIC5_9HELO|nr:hypothetical protein BJ875DRAFT_16154 [Amylocarpus encephaloides]